MTGLGAASANGDALRYEQGGMLAGALSTGTIGAATKYMSRGAAAVAASAVCIATVTRAGILRRLYANLLTAPGGPIPSLSRFRNRRTTARLGATRR